MTMDYPHDVPTPLPLQMLGKVCLADSMRWFPHTSNNLTVHTLGLVGESGEFADIVKKSIRGSLPQIEIKPDNHTRALLIEELTDILIYIGNVAALLQVDLEASLNIKREINEERFGEPKPNLYIAESKLPKDLR
jgi:NTP pyrophosphatase (non-canonical NTP hydrolase)